MEAGIRKPYQGVFNIIRFNWHFYVIAAAFTISLLAAAFFLEILPWVSISIAVGIITTISISLLVSYYVYDRSDLYAFNWFRKIRNGKIQNIVNIHAGFDETSTILKKTFPECNLLVLDFYDPSKHTEVSIERARKAYPPFDGTMKITTDKLPLAVDRANIIFNIFALHEVRDRKERIDFLKLQAAKLDYSGRVVVVEHLRDLRNFLAYNIGFLHFHSEAEWLDNFLHAGLVIERKFKITPFITAFILTK